MPVPIVTITDPKERQIFNELFCRIGDGRHATALPSQQAVTPFLQASGLSQATLAQIWSLVNPSNLQTFDQNQFYVLLRLVALAQTGREPALPAVNQKGLPLPRFAGFEQITGHTDASPNAFGHVPAAGPAPSSIDTTKGKSWSLSLEEEQRWTQLFQSLTHEPRLRVKEAMFVFQKSGLPQPIIDRIWTICDLDGDACLTAEEFCIAMHLLYAYLNHQIDVIPDRLPAHLLPHAQAFKTPHLSPVATNQTVASPSQITQQASRAAPIALYTPQVLSSPETSPTREKANPPKQDLARFHSALQAYASALDAKLKDVDRALSSVQQAEAALDEALELEKRRETLYAAIQKELSAHA